MLVAIAWNSDSYWLVRPMNNENALFFKKPLSIGVRTQFCSGGGHVALLYFIN